VKRLLRFGRSFALPPRQVIALGADGSASTYRLKLRFDGGIALEPARLARTRESLLVLDPAIAFHRRLYARPKQKKAADALLRSAPELFPFAPETTRYALSEVRGEAYVSALPEATLAQVAAELPPARVVLEADERADGQGALAAIERWLRSGSSADFAAAAARPLPLHYAVTAILAAAIIACLALVIWLGLGSGWRERQLQALAQELAPEAKPLLARHAVLERMAAAQHALAEQYRLPGVAAHAKLVELLTTVPQGISVRRVEFKNGVLEVSGAGGAEARDWLLARGFESAQIQITEAIAYKQYTARLPIAGVS